MFTLFTGNLQPFQFPGEIYHPFFIHQQVIQYEIQQEIEQLEFSIPEDNATVFISKYDDIFKKYSPKIDWDWRLLAALVYHESRFRPTVRSPMGAYGLMQLMPATLDHFGIDTTATPDRHIEAGVKLIKHLDTMFAPYVPDKDERIKFILASYNIGPGHVLDAQRLAKKYGKDDSVWNNNVDSFLLRKSKPQFYNDPNVQFGKCYGIETYAYVLQVTERFEYYKNLNSEL
jgi:membrane-bound lytic murein transglycosylase F